MEERTTQELIEKLSDDVHRCHGYIIEAINNGVTDSEGNVTVREDYEYNARHLIRAILAYIEAVTFSVKVTCVKQCMEEGMDVSDHERYLAVEIDSELNDKGKIIERPARIRLTNNVRFAFRLLEKSSKRRSTFDPSAEWWSCLQQTIRVRDRLMHPRFAEDIDVSGDEIVNALKAKEGFDEVLLAKDMNSEA